MWGLLLMFIATGSDLNQRIIDFRAQLNDPSLAVRIANDLANKLQEAFRNTGLISRSGATLQALSYVSNPERISNGWAIGVGRYRDLGDESQPAPMGTLRDFFADNPVLRPTPWRMIPRPYQEKLAQLRRMGLYGGRGATYANYAWVQNAGNSVAYIPARNFMTLGLNTWRSNVPKLIGEWWIRRSRSFGGKI
jgi:hypothetical protein